ncbi:MAG: hypothetical protein OHK0022_25290 [Roseiflexaceae bacterium]
MITKPDLPAQQANPPAPIAGVAVQVADFDLSVDPGLYAGQHEALASEVQQALAYVTQRFGSAPSGRFTVAVIQEPGCGIHGLAYTDRRVVQVFTCPSIERRRAVAILAHEIVHQLAHDRYGQPHLSADLILAEGVATWGAGSYWLGGQPDFRAFVRAQRAAGQFYPLATHYQGRSIAAMNALYYQWASFVDFLIATYGRERFDQLYVSGNSAPGSANYQGIYGKPLDALEREWIDWLDGSF